MKRVIVLICFLFLITGCKEEVKEKTNNVEIKPVITKVTCDEMKKLVEEGATLIDVREIDEYNEYHLDNSINISYTIIGDKINEYVKDKQEKIVVYCKSGVRSNKAANSLIEAGYKNIYDMGSINNCD